MTTIPNGVPNRIFYLDFSSNDLRHIPGQFQKFGNLRFLNILGNEKFAAHIDSFQFLDSLQSYNNDFNMSSYRNEQEDSTFWLKKSVAETVRID